MNSNPVKHIFSRMILSTLLLLVIQVINVQAADPGTSCYCSDTTFTSNWSSLIIVNTSGGNFSSTHVSTGGNPTDYRQTTHTYGNGAIVVAHLNTQCSYNPQTQGALVSLGYSYDLRHFNPPAGQAVAYRLLVFQNNTYYAGSVDSVFNDQWSTFSNTSLTATSFTKIAGTSSSTNPDFSAAGQPITFGYITANSNPNFKTVSTRISGIDNWCVRTVSQPPPTDPCCPPWDVTRLKSMLSYKGQGSIAAPYSLQFQPTLAFQNQMQAYINYLNSIDPTITSVIIDWRLHDQGTGTAPLPYWGPQVLTTGYAIWYANSTSGPSFFPANYFLFNPPGPYPMLVGTWYGIHTGIYLNDGKKFFPVHCNDTDVFVRIQFLPMAKSIYPILEFSDVKSVIQ